LNKNAFLMFSTSISKLSGTTISGAEGFRIPPRESWARAWPLAPLARLGWSRPSTSHLQQRLHQRCDRRSIDRAGDPHPAVGRKLDVDGCLPSASDAERPMSDARRNVAGSTEGNKNALKHGRYTAEAIARRRSVSALVRAGKALSREH
jgi:hypothetical protein